MYREMHSDPYYVHMQRAALPYWRSLERESSTLLLKECGLLFFGDPSTGETVEGSIEGALDTMRAGSMKHEHMKSLAELCERWPLKIAARARDEETSSAQSSPVDWQGIWDPRAGWVRASRAVAALASQVERNPRWQVMRGVGVAGLAADGRGVCARLADGRRVRAKKLVLACGAWTGDVLGLLGKRMELEIWRMHWGYCAAGEAALRRVPMWYCFQKPKERQGGFRDGGLYYGFPAEEEVGWSRVDEKPLNSHAPSTHPHARQLKVGIDWVPEGEEFRPRSMAQFDSRPSPVMRSLLESFLERHWEGMGPLDHLVVSPYSMTPDLNFVLGQLPDLENVFIFAGDCGRCEFETARGMRRRRRGARMCDKIPALSVAQSVQVCPPVGPVSGGKGAGQTHEFRCGASGPWPGLSSIPSKVAPPQECPVMLLDATLCKRRKLILIFLHCQLNAFMKSGDKIAGSVDWFGCDGSQPEVGNRVAEERLPTVQGHI